MHPVGHTRLPVSSAGRGTVAILQPAQVFPDTHAHFQGENPQHVYAVGSTRGNCGAPTPSSSTSPSTFTRTTWSPQ